MEFRKRSPVQWVVRNRRLVGYLFSFVVVVFVQTMLYWWGMAELEGRPRSLQESLNIIVQSLTSTGYGQDAPWTSTGMQALMIVAQFTGIAFIAVAIPQFVVPWARAELTETRVPDALEDAEDHVVIWGYTSLCANLVDDLEARGEQYVIVEDDEEQAEQLFEEGRNVVHGDINDDETLRNVHVEDALAVVVGTRRQENVIGTILSLSESNPDLEIICLIDDPEQSRYLRFAGATTVLSPKHRLGKSLADKAQNVVSTDLENVEDFDADLEIAEFPVTDDSPLYGQRLDSLAPLERTGATLVGVWLRGEFVTDPSSEAVADENTVLVVAGTESQLERIESIAESGGRSSTAGPVIIAGHGVVGTTAEGILRKADQETTVIDTEPGDGIDVVGDATRIPTFDEAGIGDAETVILALPDDDDAILATLVARQADDDVEIVVAANDADSASELYRAGADYVLALPKVAGRMTTLDLFDEDVMTLREQIQLTRTHAPELEGTHPNDERIRERTDSVIVGVKRDDALRTEFDEDLELETGDEVLVAGTDRGVSNFKTEFGEREE
ncbi:potassium channel family protein [Natronococcus occultus]|uniref:K+ transport system, NAD-binding component n=1 Tax=Natronococcus occultus SP4 TaxID=694430 RepID=L0K0N3_9EURY|nr:NAD-binding protein [Natronococcus occultus]AGB38566.1 K+ transport system, NAD-binding component [Natronococcus occultus SP4]